MSGRPGFARALDAPPALDGHQPRQRRAAEAVRPHRHDAAVGRRLVGIDVLEVARRREREPPVIAAGSATADSPYPPFTASRSASAALNDGTVEAGIDTASPVRGLRPDRAGRFFTDRRGLDQGLEVRPRAALGAEGARINDRGAGLGGEQGQHLLVVVGERLAVRLVGEEEVADVRAPVAHRRALKGAGERPGGLDAERTDVAREVGEAKRPRQRAEVLEQTGVVGPDVARAAPRA